MVFDPLVSVMRSLSNSLGRLDLNVQSQGFVFTEHPEFTHGTIRLQATQDRSSNTRCRRGFLMLPISFSETMKNANQTRTS